MLSCVSILFVSNLNEISEVIEESNNCILHVNRIYSMAMTLISKFVTPGVVVGCANPVLVEMLGLESLSAAFSGVSALRGLAALLGKLLHAAAPDTDKVQ